MWFEERNQICDSSRKVVSTRLAQSSAVRVVSDEIIPLKYSIFCLLLSAKEIGPEMPVPE